MIDETVQYQGGVTLVGGGDPSAESIEESLKIAPFLVAADGGADHAILAGFEPLAVIGDFDSVSARVRSQLPDAKFIHVAEQESTDFEKCLERIQAPFVLATGFTSGQIDHTLAALSVLVRGVGPIAIIFDNTDVIVSVPHKISLELPIGMRMSLFPMGHVSGTSEGLEWPVAGLAFAPDGRVGTSNRVTGPVVLEFDSPGMLAILPRAALAAVVASLCD
ncbi:MAG: thiamine diphosphokinase [Boseongicola sp.]|nr:MAG: thiamine diphosphokinase [Boseongicola sp.]